MKYKYLIVTLLVLIAGTFLIFWVGAQFLEKEPSREITFELEELPEEQITKDRDFDYLAPDFELPDFNGNKIKLSDYRGKAVVLSFWTTWNPACQDQIKILDVYYQEIEKSKDVTLLTINNQEDKSIALSFISRGKYDLPVLLDEKGETGELYKINILPATYFINLQGRLMEKYIGILNVAEIKEKVAKLF